MTLGKSSGYFGQLDGLRALSVAAVAWSHWRLSLNWYSDSIVPWGELGVETFFIISGFLITGILLDNRSSTARFFVLRQFFARRFLRIFPLFYAALVILAIVQAKGVSETWLWHASYLSNVYFYLHGWLGQLSHFWSLAVEEQFYLGWPLLMIFLPQRFLLSAILISIFLAPTFEKIMTLAFPNHVAAVTASVLMPSCLDALGIGALLAYGVRKKYPMQRIAFRLLLAGLFGLTCWGVADFPSAFEPWRRLAGNCVLGWLVYSAAVGFKGPFGWLLQSPPFGYIGKISYGLYVIHNFAISMCLSLLMLLGHPSWLERGYAIPAFRLLAFISLTIGLSALSWHLFEKPINNLKCKFPYPVKDKSNSLAPNGV